MVKASKKHLESYLQKQVLEWLILQPGYFTWRSYTGPIIHRNKRFAPNPMSGFPDIFGFNPNNRVFAIELKRPDGGILSDKQKIWIKNLEAKGVFCVVARSLTQVIDELEIYEKEG